MHNITTSEKQTFCLAKKFAKQLQGGEIIGLVGELGAGKTIFVKSLAIGLGIKKIITSPTFVLMKIYPVKKHQTIRSLVHIDAYRIKSAKDIIAIGTQEYFNQLDTVVVIEWADKIKNVLPKKTRYIKIINQGVNKRKLIFNYNSIC